MTLFLAMIISFAFAAVYALLFAMLGSRAGELTTALGGGRRVQRGTMPMLAASRRFTLA